jgi:alkanesulfonate monooxygenase SsuD/methylene tetrahydromethanopterin reductase-like flavin-dependent oxidoreductase (luciferase family)
MRIGVAFGSRLQLPFDDLVALAAPATLMGFDRIWTPRRSMPDSFYVCLRWWEESIKHRAGGIDVGIGVVPAPDVWTPAALACQAASLSELTGGRFILGIGTGGYGPEFWKRLGLPNRPIGVMRDYMGALKAAFRGGSITYEGEILSLRNFTMEKAPPRVPIYLAAMGPQMLRLAGRCADGVLMNWVSPDDLPRATQSVEGGIAAAGRERRDVSLAMYLRCAVDDDVDTARRFMAAEILDKLAPTDRRPIATSLIGYRGQFARLGFEEEVVRLENRFRQGASAQDLVDDVPPEMCAAAGYYGTSEDACDRVAELASGIDELIIRVVAAGTEPAVRTMRALSPARIRALTSPERAAPRTKAPSQ